MFFQYYCKLVFEHLISLRSTDFLSFWSVSRNERYDNETVQFARRRGQSTTIRITGKIISKNTAWHVFKPAINITHFRHKVEFSQFLIWQNQRRKNFEFTFPLEFFPELLILGRAGTLLFGELSQDSHVQSGSRLLVWSSSPPCPSQQQPCPPITRLSSCPSPWPGHGGPGTVVYSKLVFPSPSYLTAIKV